MKTLFTQLSSLPVVQPIYIDTLSPPYAIYTYICSQYLEKSSNVEDSFPFMDRVIDEIAMIDKSNSKSNLPSDVA